MNVAFVKKELRELAGIVALALLAQLLIVLWQSGYASTELLPDSQVSRTVFPFVTCSFQEFFLGIQSCLALALGFRQTVWEHTQGTFLLLLHRPMDWQRIVRHKLLSGWLVLAIAGALPILLYVLVVTGLRPALAPFEWSLTWPCWRIIALSMALYLAAFVSGLRAGRWFGTRLLPMIGASILLWPLLMVADVVMAPALLLIVTMVWLALRHVIAHREFA